MKTIRCQTVEEARAKAKEVLGSTVHISTIFFVKGEPSLRDFTFTTTLQS